MISRTLCLLALGSGPLPSQGTHKHARPAFMEMESRATHGLHFDSHKTDNRSRSRSGKDAFYDYVVVGGNGTAGSAAIRALLQSGAVKPADILCVDPVGSDCGEVGVHSVQSACTGLDVQSRRIVLADTTEIRYKQCLIATGKTPSSLVLTERAVGDRLGNLAGLIDPALLVGDVFAPRAATAIATPAPVPAPLPALCFMETGGPAGAASSAAQVQALHAHVASGKHVTLIGDCSSDVVLLELATSLAATATAATTADTTAATASKGSRLIPDRPKPPTRVTLLCATSGALSQRLPRHMSQAITRRLRLVGVEVVPFAQVKYITATNDGTEGDTSTTSTVYCTHTFDQLQTATFETDTVVFFNADTGIQVEHFGISSGGLEAGVDGGIAANKSMQAAAGVYVAGYIANVSIGSSRSLGGNGAWGGLGRGCVDGTDHAVQTAQTAAKNMVATAAIHGSTAARSSSVDELSCHMYDRVPAYTWTVPAAHLHFSLIGQCSSALVTHSFFWRVSSGTSGQQQQSAASGSSSSAPSRVTASADLSSSVNDKSGDELDSDSFASRDDANNNSYGETIGVLAASANEDIKRGLLSYFGMKTGEEPARNYGFAPLVVRGKHSSVKGRSSAAGNNSAANANATATATATATTASKNKKTAVKKEPMQVPIGLGAIVYVNDEQVIVGIGICGLPLSNVTITAEVEARARACVGTSLRELADADSSTLKQAHPNLNPDLSTSVNANVNSAAVLEGMCKVILGPAVGISDPLHVSHMPRPTHRKVFASSMLMREHYNHQINLLQTPSLTVLKDSIMSNRARSSVKDRVSAAFSRQITGN